MGCSHEEPGMKPRISLITFGTRDLPRMVAFYRDGLGFPTHNYTPGDDMVMFRLEGTWLGLFPRDELAKDATISVEGSGFSGVALAHNEPSKEDVDRVFAEALAAGATAVKTPEDVFWGGYSGYFADPEGNLWEVAWNPFTDLT
jgi:catechol 2,3-dioxygenase-like lactoylglutathione lyase family enzyme